MRKSFLSNNAANTWLAASLHRVGRGAFYKLYLLWRRGRKCHSIRRPAASPGRCALFFRTPFN